MFVQQVQRKRFDSIDNVPNMDVNNFQIYNEFLMPEHLQPKSKLDYEEIMRRRKSSMIDFTENLMLLAAEVS